MSIAQVDNPESPDIEEKSQGLLKLTGDVFCREWLYSLCNNIPDTFFGLLILRDESSKDYQAAVTWPEPQASMGAATELVERVIEEKRGLVTALENGSASVLSGEDIAYLLAFPVIRSKSVVAIATLAITARDEGCT